MVQNLIERDILIAAPAEVVWKVITEPDQITQWFSDAAQLDAHPGGQGTLTFGAKATNEAVTVPLQVEAFEPPHRFAFRWDYPAGEQPCEGNSLYVEFTLTPEGEGTRLRVVESGFAALQRSEEEKLAYVEAHSKGWDAHLQSLDSHVSGQS
jgi:uncharacterized protein YndB with AHSA1/START domain